MKPIKTLLFIRDFTALDVEGKLRLLLFLVIVLFSSNNYCTGNTSIAYLALAWLFQQVRVGRDSYVQFVVQVSMFPQDSFKTDSRDGFTTWGYRLCGLDMVFIQLMYAKLRWEVPESEYLYPKPFFQRILNTISQRAERERVFWLVHNEALFVLKWDAKLRLQFIFFEDTLNLLQLADKVNQLRLTSSHSTRCLINLIQEQSSLQCSFDCGRLIKMQIFLQINYTTQINHSRGSSVIIMKVMQGDKQFSISSLFWKFDTQNLIWNKNKNRNNNPICNTIGDTISI